MKNLKKVHTNFTLNGNIFTSEIELLIYAETISSDIFSFLNNWFSNADTVTVKTSGSTGKPKAIKLKKEHMYNSALGTGVFFNLKEKTTALLCLPTNFIAGKMMLVRALVLGWQLDVVNPSSHPLDGNKDNYDFCAMVPLQAQNSLSDLDRIKILIIGGAPINTELQRVLQAIKTQIFATYGMTETITHIALKRINGDVENSFKVLPNILIEKDKRGCLVIEAPKISDKKIKTNDLVEIIDDNHFNWLGRFDNIINSGGVKISPEVIENKLLNVFPFKFFIAGLPDDILGEKVVLIGEGKKQNIEPFNLKKYLNKYELPKDIFFVKSFIETTNHKLNRKKTLKLMRE